MAGNAALAGRDLSSIWVRVDDRLIHGQVTVGWRQYLRCDEIWVVDDLAREDPYVQDALRLAAPEGVEVRVYGVEEAGALEWPPLSPPRALYGGEEENCAPSAGARSSLSPVVWKGEGWGGGQVLLQVKTPEAACGFVERGMPLERLNVGNLASRPGSVRAFKNISLTPAHVGALDALAARGVCITFQLAPEDARADWQAVRRRLRL